MTYLQEDGGQENGIQAFIFLSPIFLSEKLS